MAKPFPSEGVAQDASGPSIRRPELDLDTPLAENGWKIYDENKAVWVDAWVHYYEEKTTANATRWAQYEKNKDDVQRRWRSATESRPFPLKGAKGAPAATKISFNLSVDTDIAAAARQWSKASAPRPDGTLPKPQADLNSPLPRVSTAGRPGLSRAKSTPYGMRSPITPSSASPFQFSPSPASSSPKTPSPIARSSPRPILRQNSSSPTIANPYLSRSAPATHSPPRTFWTTHEETLETWKREQDLRQRQADFERQREQARRATEEQRQREKRATEQERQKLDDAIAAARRADEEKQRRKLAARAAEQAAAEQRRTAAEPEQRREEERARREAERLRREEVQQKRTRDAWENYEQRWRNANTQEIGLSFASIPWPMESQPHSPSDITSNVIKDFVLSPLHSVNKSHKQRLREQLLRFHPDRFEGRWLSRVRESDRAEVKDAINTVARYLNEALSQCSA